MPGADIIGVAYRGKQNLYAENNGWTNIYFFELSEMKRALNGRSVSVGSTARSANPSSRPGTTTKRIGKE
jgi:hypothetical protein